MDEEVLRAHTKTLLELWVMKTRELMESIDQETELLQKMMEMGGGELPSAAAAGPPPPPVNKPSKPLVITHEMLRVRKNTTLKCLFAFIKKLDYFSNAQK